MWAWRSVLCVSLVYGLALDSNTIRSSKEATQHSSELMDHPHGNRTVTNSNSNRRPTSPCNGPDCNAPSRGGCSNRAQRRPSPTDRPMDRQQDRDTDGQRDTDGFNRTKAPEMSSCVRSGDCASGLCCVRYLTGKRCQRIPVEGEACLLRGSTKLRRNLGRCDCDAGLTCTAATNTTTKARAEPGKSKGQGVCLPHPRQAQRKTRHSGKKRRPPPAESSC